MEKFTNEETKFIKSLNKPIQNVNINLANSIINKMLQNSEYKELIKLLNNLYDFSQVPKNMADRLIQANNKKCISIFLENEESLYFFSEKEIKKLKEFLNICVVNIKLEESYDYYYNLSRNDQILKSIDYINEFGFNIDRDVNNKFIIKI